MIRTALLGYGLGGSVFHEPFLADNPDYRIDAVVTSSPERRTRASERYNVVPTFVDILTSAERFDLVVITSPTALHTEHALAALDAGLNVVVDKPLSISAAAGRKVVERAAVRKRSLTVYQSKRWDCEIMTARELITAGDLGTPERLELNFSRQIGALRENWRDTTSTEEGGGVTFDLGSHMIDAAQHLLGTAVEIVGTTKWMRGGAADDELDVVVTHRGGATSHIVCSWVAEQTLPRLVLECADGTYSVPESDPQERKLKAGKRPCGPGFGYVPTESWGRVTHRDGTSEPVPTLDGDCGAFYRTLAYHLEHGGELPVDPTDTVRTLELIDRHLATQTQPKTRSA